MGTFAGGRAYRPRTTTKPLPVTTQAAPRDDSGHTIALVLQALRPFPGAVEAVRKALTEYVDRERRE